MSNLPEHTSDSYLEVDEELVSALVPMYHVVLLDDDDHSYDYVIEMLMDLFGHSERRAYEMACEVDARKRVIVETTYKERAEMKCRQIHAYGADWRIPHCKGSMSANVEPAE
ncbi:MAG TPA: Clp protease ClpS [Bacteroidetes bacterium]|jgi:ATP-dependent Clp protease adaptor protein ClpS|nr:Clp protease ClpS [Bacteroidota bacterium]